jgi:hypothetical protein
MHGTEEKLGRWALLLTTRRCPRCSDTMRLVLLVPGKPGQDVRTFECTGCDNREEFVVDWD